ncbi:replicative DNA helicase [Arsenophonus nasoniae]|uniref:DNA 5'-3' helicase n=1 Tax=Arsenophonus nasoniae TaxID=638 RepID=A0AA95GD19_9GAMM|nr:DnaB-like helicase C-terminal domain-containing protein [Arsenophonus nasoniae]WGL95992.1 DnaB-like helicase C-terminal domain-containing protein [Arsenophonus nasoniae]
MFNTEIEASVIGGLLISGLTPDASDVLSTLEPEAFSSNFYRDIYKTIQKQAKTRNLIDMMMVAEAMGDGNFGSVMTLAKNCPSAANLKGYAGMVFDNYRRRKMLSLMDSVRREIEHGTIENASRAINQFMSDATELNSSKDDIKPVHLSELIADYTEILENRLKNGEQSDTLKTGIHELDEITGGINQVDLVIVAARPGMGKTELALKVAESVAEQKITGTNQNRGILIFSMEMDAQQIIERQIANSSMLPVSTLRNPAKMNDEGWGKVSSGIGRLHDLDIWVVDASKLSVEQIDSIATRHKKSYPSLSLIMVDYLGLIEKPSAERNDLAVAYISSSLKRLAKKLKTPVMSLSQLSRDVEKRVNKRPVNADLRDSGSIEQDADSIIMLYRDAMYNEDSQAAKYAEIIVTKNRFGQTGTVYQEFRNGHFMETNQQEAAKACQTKSNSFQKKYSKGAPI